MECYYTEKKKRIIILLRSTSSLTEIAETKNYQKITVIEELIERQSIGRSKIDMNNDEIVTVDRGHDRSRS